MPITSLQDIQANLKSLQERMKTEGVTQNGQYLIKPGTYDPTTNTIKADEVAKPVIPADIPPYNPPPVAEKANFNETSSIADFFKSLMPKEGGVPDIMKGYMTTTEDLTDAEKLAGIPEKETALTEKQKITQAAEAKLAGISAKLGAIETRTKAEELAMKQEGLTQAGATARNRARERYAAIEALPLQAEAYVAQAEVAAAQGNERLASDALNRAQGKVDNYFKIKSDYNKSIFDYQLNLIDKVYDYASKKDQQKLDDLRQQTQNEFTLQRDNIAIKNDLVKTAIENGQGDLVQQIMVLDEKSPTFEQDIARLAGQIKPKPKGGDGLTEYQQMQAFLNISNKFQADSIMNQALKGQTAVAIANQVIANPKSATNQLKSLYSLVKNLDPDSAVREGELALANQTTSYLQRFQTSLNRINEGQVIAPEAAKALAQATIELASAWNSTAERRKQQYVSQANVAGVGQQFNAYIGGYGNITPSTAEQFNPDDWEYVPETTPSQQKSYPKENIFNKKPYQ